MNKLSSFAAGILLATAVTGAVYFSETGKAADNTVKKTNTAETAKLSNSQMKDKLEHAGYVVQTKAAYDKDLADAKSSAEKSVKTKTVNRVVFQVTDGMTSIDVGKLLEKANIVDDAFQFSKDVEKKGVENHLRPGTYVVDSTMSYDKVISTIFKK
ncbi:MULTISPECIES: aminodeoxychorismate lyase [Heyndrickxia]|uniref:aminodeoxychorismate lyase n=1 Tax=Heyndrickxia TaxID=2837504 RepID=UPI0007793AB3|nr:MULTISPECIES: aminodeoxychorismate lyase [Heyndrickxia]MBQ4910667.1 aminodeoxychorismate lyase [Heyndrickxia faecalis]NWN94390.1 aminodeoxychorismate lyase [Bacillus sp. (in: firmicutes)]